MLVLTLVMFGVSATYFIIDIILVSNGVLHPQEHPNTVIDLWGWGTTALLVCQGINVCLLCGL